MADKEPTKEITKNSKKTGDTHSYITVNQEMRDTSKYVKPHPDAPSHTSKYVKNGKIKRHAVSKSRQKSM